MSKKPYLVQFPSGIPTYSSRHGFYISTPGHLPVLQLHNDWDLFWIHEGEATWEFKDGRQMSAGRDQFAILPPFVPATIRETKHHLKFWYCHFNFRLVSPQIMKEVQEEFQEPGKNLLLPLTFSRSQAPQVWRAYRALTKLPEQDAHHPWRLEQALIELVSALTAFAHKRSKGRSDGNPTEPLHEPDSRVADLCHRIESNPANPWKITELARSIGISTGHLHHLCRHNLGKSLKSLIIEIRLQKALKLLKEGHGGRLYSIKEVSALSGFSSQHFFSRQFKSHFHISPLAYRNGSSLA